MHRVGEYTGGVCPVLAHMTLNHVFFIFTGLFTNIFIVLHTRIGFLGVRSR